MKITTWNISWELQTGTKTKGVDGSKCMKNKTNICKDGIYEYIKKSESDIILLQEANIDIEKYKMLDYEAIKSKSGMESMITLYKPKKLRYMSHISSEFDVGRPYQIIKFEEIDSKRILKIINVHFDHINKTIGSIYNGSTIYDMFKRGKIKRTDNIIMGGDFNSNLDIIRIYEEEKKRERIRLLFNFSMYEMKRLKSTCCYKDFENKDSGKNWRINNSDKYNYDHILIKGKIKMNKYWIGKPNLLSSDHLPVNMIF